MQVERQLRWLRAYALVTYPFACVPFLFLFFKQHGMDAGQYGEILTAYYVAMFVAEIPTGMLADRLGPKPMLVAGPLLLATGFATLILRPDYHGFILGEVLLGLGHAVLSGPPTTLLYETLQQNGQEHRYLREEGRIHARRLYGTGTAFLIGGLLVRTGNDTGTAFVSAIVATCIGNLLASVVGSLLSPPRHQVQNARSLAILAHAREELRKRPVRWLLIYWLVLFSLLRYPFHNYQPYLEAAGRVEPLFANAIFVGVIFAVLNLVAAPLSTMVPRLVERYGRRSLFWGMPLLLCASLLLMGYERYLHESGAELPVWCWIGVSMFLVQQVPFAMHWALVHEFVNHRIGSRARTTVLSLLSLSARLVYAGVNLLLFHLQHREGLATALTVVGAGGLVAAALALWLRPRGLLRGERPVA